MTEKTFQTCGKLLALTIGLALVTACGSSPPTRYYQLEERLSQTDNSSSSTLSVRVGPLYIARYLQQPNIVTRQDDYQVEVAEFDRWVEPLEQSIGRILTTNLSDTLSSNWVHEFGVGNDAIERFDYQVLVTITRFDVDANDTATLTAQWNLVTPQPSVTVLAKRTVLTQPVASSSYSSQAAALSDLISELAKEIADNILAQQEAAASQQQEG
ncbi:MAG: PqiC family protein [Gammaproteobacteria bacterium]|nr:PqiC family protein [Gammaproteobacteria bacterium]